MSAIGWGWTAKPPRGVRTGEAFAVGDQVNVLTSKNTYSIVARCATKAMARDVAKLLNSKRKRRRAA